MAAQEMRALDGANDHRTDALDRANNPCDLSVTSDKAAHQACIAEAPGRPGRHA